MTQETKKQTPITVKNSFAEWLIAILINYLIFQGFWSYNAKLCGIGYNIDSVNIATADAALFVFALALLIGPLYRVGMYQKWGIRLRRPIALGGSLLAFIHSYLAIKSFIDMGIMPQEEMKTSAILGIAAGIIMLLLIATSYPSALYLLKAKAWRIFQLTNCFLLILISIVHYMVLGYYQLWQIWFLKHNHPVPPASLVVTAFCVLVILFRTSDGIRWIIQNIRHKMKKSSEIIVSAEMAE